MSSFQARQIGRHVVHVGIGPLRQLVHVRLQRIGETPSARRRCAARIASAARPRRTASPRSRSAGRSAPVTVSPDGSVTVAWIAVGCVYSGGARRPPGIGARPRGITRRPCSVTGIVLGADAFEVARRRMAGAAPAGAVEERLARPWDRRRGCRGSCRAGGSPRGRSSSAGTSRGRRSAPVGQVELRHACDRAGRRAGTRRAACRSRRSARAPIASGRGRSRRRARWSHGRSRTPAHSCCPRSTAAGSVGGVSACCWAAATTTTTQRTQRRRDARTIKQGSSLRASRPLR